MNSSYIRTDLASESENARSEKASVREYTENGIAVHEMTVRADGETDSPVYVTLSVGKIWFMGKNELESVTRSIAKKILTLCEKALTHTARNVLIVCLGNRRITSDAIGPLCADGITVTRHLKSEKPELYKAFGSRAISLLSPGVTGETGIETFESIRSAVKTVKADIVICVDALAARSSEHLMTSIQITDAGIAPGSGIGNARKEISRATLGVPVISIGVPTVVQSSTLVCDVLARAGINEPTSSVREILENERSFFVTPKNSDIAVAAQARLISGAINLAFLGFSEL